MLAQKNNIYLRQLNCRLDNFKQKIIGIHVFFVMFLFYYICDELHRLWLADRETAWV